MTFLSKASRPRCKGSKWSALQKSQHLQQDKQSFTRYLFKVVAME